MRRLFPLFCLCLVLTACGSRTVAFTLTTDLTDPADRTEIFDAVQRVVTRRASRLESTLTDISVTAKDNSGATLSFTTTNDVATQLTEELLSPFSLKIMLQSDDESGDLYVEEQGWFTNTGITEKDILWTQSFTKSDGTGVVVLLLSDEGRTRFDTLIGQNIGRTIGLFVRDKLMSKMQIERTMEKDKIAIGGIPTPDIAGIFADDVNVGIHISFSKP